MSTFIHKNLVGADAVHPAAFVQATDPGSVGANLFWLDTSTSPPTLKVRNVSNTAWTIFSAGAAGATGATGAAGTNGTAGPVGPAGTNIVTGAAPYINIQEQQSSGVASQGTFTTGAFRTRTLNTINANDQNLASLASNQITLPAGTWRCFIRCPVQNATHQARLQNITDSVTLVTGSSGISLASSLDNSFVSGRFFIQSAKVIEVQQRFSGGAGGPASSFGTEVYTVAEFWLEGPPPPFMGSTQLTVLPSSGAARSRQDQQQHSLNTPPQ